MALDRDLAITRWTQRYRKASAKSAQLATEEVLASSDVQAAFDVPAKTVTRKRTVSLPNIDKLLKRQACCDDERPPELRRSKSTPLTTRVAPKSSFIDRLVSAFAPSESSSRDKFAVEHMVLVHTHRKLRDGERRNLYQAVLLNLMLAKLQRTKRQSGTVQELGYYTGRSSTVPKPSMPRNIITISDIESATYFPCVVPRHNPNVMSVRNAVPRTVNAPGAWRRPFSKTVVVTADQDDKSLVSAVASPPDLSRPIPVPLAVDPSDPVPPSSANLNATIITPVAKPEDQWKSKSLLRSNSVGTPKPTVRCVPIKDIAISKHTNALVTV